MTKLHSIYVLILNNETEFITKILEEMETWIFHKFRTSIGQRLFKYRGTKIWNDVDTELKSISDHHFNYFKTKLKTILIEK
jgi:hypothetical protein